MALPESVDDTGLERRLFPVPPPSRTARPLPDWSEVHRELRRKSVTLSLLWQEYKETHPEGLQYSRFCEQYRAWAAKLDLVMRQEHRAGEKLVVDYAGQTVPVVDRETGEARQAQIFVAVLGASSYTFAEATWTQTLPDWTASHVRAFEFYGGCPELVVPDNLRSGVSRAHRYEPDLNPTYHDLARHYGVAVLPARVRRIVAMALAKWKSSRPGETQDVINIITGEGVPQEAVDDFAERLNEELGRLSG